MEPRERAAFVSAYTRVLTAAWSDDAYTDRLAADPHSAIAEQGLEAPVDIELRIVREVTGEPDLEEQVRRWEQGRERGLYELFVPSTPQVSTAELAESELEGVSGGFGCCCTCTPCCTC